MFAEGSPIVVVLLAASNLALVFWPTPQVEIPAPRVCASAGTAAPPAEDCRTGERCLAELRTYTRNELFFKLNIAFGLGNAALAVLCCLCARRVLPARERTRPSAAEQPAAEGVRGWEPEDEEDDEPAGYSPPRRPGARQLPICR